MLSQARHLLYPKLLVRFGRTDRALEIIARGLEAGPSHLELDLRLLEAHAAAAEGDAKRAHRALERGFALHGLSTTTGSEGSPATADEMRMSATVRQLGKLFNRIATGLVSSLRSAKIGDARILFIPGEKERVRLVGLCTDTSQPWAQQPVRLLFEDYPVSEAQVLPLPGGHGRGQFEFRVKRALLAQLGSSAVSLEVDGVRHVVTSKQFGPQWPAKFKKNAATNDTLLANLKSGYKLDYGGGLVLPKNINESWLRSVFGLYDEARAWFKANYDYDLYPVGGTLLGYARNGEVISFDNDFDTGYLSKHTSPDEIRREYKEILVALLKAGVDVRILTKDEPPRVRGDYFWYGNGKTHIDVFVGAFINGKYRRPTFVDTQLTPEDFFPFQTGKMNGYDILVPKELEKKVAAVYGPGWRKPDPLWKKVRSPEIVAYRKQISLTAQDLLEVAAVSPVEGPKLKQLVESGALDLG